MLRFLIFCFNFIVLGVGVAMMVAGGLYYADIGVYNEIIEEIPALNVVPPFTIALGAVICVIAFLGCCGALKRSSCMLYMYAGILFVIVVGQLACGIYGLVLMKNSGTTIKDEVTTILLKSFMGYGKEKTITALFQTMQTKFECCGVNEPRDYETILQKPAKQFPGGCCAKPTEELCGQNDKIFSKGCAGVLYEELHKRMRILGIILIVICAVALLGAVFAVWLASSL